MSERLSILVIDDQQSIRNVLSTILKEEGYVVDTASNGKEAIDKSSSKLYNLALIDIRLPDIEGTKLLNKLRNTTPRMARIVMTGHPSLQNAIEAVNRGADAYILKPFDVENVLQKIKDQLDRQRKARKYTEEQVTEFITTRARELRASHQRPNRR